MALDRTSFSSSGFSEGFCPPDFKDLFRDPSKEQVLKLPLGFSYGSIGDGVCPLHSDHEVRRRVFAHLLKRLSKEELMGKEDFDGYLRYKYRLNFKPGSLFNTFTAVRFFLSFLKGTGKRVLSEITRGDLEGFVEHEQDRGLKISSVRTRLAQAYGFLDFLTEAGIVHPDVVGRKMRLRLPESLPRSMDPEDVDRLLSVRGRVRDRAMVLMLLRTGMRIGELLRTKVRDVDLKGRKVLIYEGEKNRLGRVVYFSDDAKEALDAWLKERDCAKAFLFYAQGRDSMCYSSARMMFEGYLESAGLSHKGYTLHSLRHSYATELLNAGMPLECLQELMGHTNIEITRRYARLSDKSREEAYFRAMSIIERGERDGHYRCDHQLPEIFEEEELLAPHGEELHEPYLSILCCGLM